MYDPNDDTDVTSGTTDGAPMETTSPPLRLQHPKVWSCVAAPSGLSPAVSLWLL